MSDLFPIKRKLNEDDMTEKTPVSVLQELCVQENESVPMYESIPHESDTKMFSCIVQAFDLVAKGSGRSKREAKHEASANLLEILKKIDRFKSKFNVVPQTPRLSSETDAVGTLLDICVQRNWPIAMFEEMQAYGEPHRPRFTIVCRLSSIQRTGTSTTKKSAKQLAAKAMLDVVQSISQNEGLQQVATLDAEPIEKVMKTYRELKRSDTKYTAIRLRARHQYFRHLPVEDRNKAYDILIKDGAMTNSSKEIVDLTCRTLNLKYEIKNIPDHPDRLKAFILLAMAELINSEDPNSPEVLAEREEARKNIASLCDTKKFYDVTFVVNGVEFRAHKNILSSRYEYFDSMFSNWKEAEQNKIPMHDIAPEVFKIILEFIYKGQLSEWKEKLNEHAVDLIKAANMFGIHGLRKKCEKYIIRAGEINVQTACEYFILADKHNAPQLKAAAAEFISMNLEEVKRTGGYKVLKRHHTSTTEIFEILSPSKRPKLM